MDDLMKTQLGEDKSLSKAFRATFKHDIQRLSPRRRVILVARSFDVATGLQYLSEHFEENVTFGLMTAQPRSGGFQIAFYLPPKLVPCTQLVGRFAETVKGRLRRGRPRPPAVVARELS
jgi:hypothetical protein